MLNKKIAISSILATLLVSNLHAGGFVEDTTNSLEGISYSSVAIADLDGDSDLDILITGKDSNNNKISKIYLNNGSGSFSEDTSNSLEGVYVSSVAIDDLDGDSHNDILITGKDSNSNIISKIYLNDGSGGFSEDTTNSLDGVQYSSIAIDDLDGDSHNDILITGLNSSNNPISKIYLNDGSGNFSEDTSNSIEGVTYSSVAIADLDGDNYNDILITGGNSSFQLSSKIYLNDGNGSFSEDTTNSLEGVSFSSVAIADLDGDSDNDILITGKDSNSNRISKIYLNDGNGGFSEDTTNSLEGVQYSSIAIADLDGDSDLDILITGFNSSNQAISKIYLNDGSGGFSEDTTNSLKGVTSSSIAVADLDGDSYNDILITGHSSNGKISKIYFADFTAPTLSKTVAKDKSLTLVYSESLNESSVPDSSDFVVSGSESGNISISSVAVSGTKVKLTLSSSLKGGENITVSYTKGTNKIQDSLSNDAEDLINGSVINNTVVNKRIFEEDTSNSLDGISYSSIAVEDLNGDGHNDILVTGYNSDTPVSKIYFSDGNGNFELDTSNSLEGVYNSSVAIADLDGDSDLDILITGYTSSFQKTSKIYLNDGNGNFSEDTNNSLDDVDSSSVAIADLDGDSDLDILITGMSSSFQKISKIYKNDGSGNFSEDTNSSLDGAFYPSVAIEDLDGDSDLDILITGSSSNGSIAKIYKNDGNGNFSEDTSNSLEGVYSSSVAIEDLDGDSDLDILITGKNSNGNISKIYKNDGSGNFSEDTSNSLEAISYSSVAIADIDGDSYNDILITGNSSNGNISKIYLNDGSGNFSEDTSNSLEGVGNSSVVIKDLDGDNYNDILITGQTSTGDKISKIYLSKKPTIDLSSVVNANKWSMITIPSGKSVSVSNIPNSPTLWRYDNDSNNWVQPDTLEAYKGYWIYTSSINGYDEISATITDSTAFSSAISSIKESYEDKFYMFGISTEEIGNYSAPFSFLNLQSSLLESSSCYTLFFYYDSQNSTWKSSGEVPYLSAGWILFSGCESE